ncbi:16S rRNA (cytidine(1402)-2'-O)-methyltransferase [Candidatus Daviesbacteria bacterium]|nr:16S rRNA (cytidine(1402)-2'-O)-methyltransferase [Candidatus Daviesbacteria bacterium]
MLYIVSTPIGNLKDITLRALDTLNQVDEIICEDQRRTQILLNHYKIKKPLLTLNDFNEFKQVDFLINKLQLGQTLALVSDAGTPLISDPGFKLVRKCIELGIKVEAIPGPASLITALTVSSLPPDKFLFLGFLPEKTLARMKLLKNLKEIYNLLELTFISFVSPYKLVTTLKDMLNEFGDIEVVLAKELTKIYESVSKTQISTLLKNFEKQKPKGEYVLLFRLGN